MTSVPSRTTAARAQASPCSFLSSTRAQPSSNSARSWSRSSSALVQYIFLGSMKTTGSSRRMAERSIMYASFTEAGVYTFRPGVCA